MYANKQTYTGIIPPIITPLREDRTLDVEGLQRLIDFDIAGGVSGVFAMGSSGEAMMTSRAVWLDTIKHTVAFAGGRVKVFCGVIDASTTRVIENIKAAEQVGAEIMVVTTAFYLQNSCQAEIIRHYEAVAASTKSKLVVYNIPGMTHSPIAPETIRQIAQLDNVVAYKDSCADWEAFQRALFLLEDRDIAVFNGAEELCSAAMTFGAQGCVPGLANFFPRLFVDMHEACKSGDTATAYRLQKEVWDLRKVLSIGKHWMSAMKHIGAHMGFGADIASLPVEPLTAEQAAKIDEIVKRCR